MQKPIFPEDILEMYLTGSIHSLVGPDVTMIFENMLSDYFDSFVGKLNFILKNGSSI